METMLINSLGLRLGRSFTKQEIIILEMVIHVNVCRELKEYFKPEFSMNDFKKMEDGMLEGSIIRRLVQDLLMNEDYSLSGLAAYTGFPEEVIYDLVSGINYNPTLTLANKIIKLHIVARRELYVSFLKDITSLN